jgi:hypothetical protein
MLRDLVNLLHLTGSRRAISASVSQTQFEWDARRSEATRTGSETATQRSLYMLKNDYAATLEQ